MTEWKDYVQFPDNESAAGTPLKLRNTVVDNLNASSDKKRAPSTPLTPSLIQKNIVKRQFTGRQPVPVSGKENKEEFNRLSTEYSLNLSSGSPKSKKQVDITPKMAPGIKLAVKESKKSRLQILKQSETNAADHSITESEYSEVSTISGETPNYKVGDNLIYYKNGYYIDREEDSFYEIEKDMLIKEKELIRVNNLLDFMAMERQFEKEL